LSARLAVEVVIGLLVVEAWRRFIASIVLDAQRARFPDKPFVKLNEVMRRIDLSDDATLPLHASIGSEDVEKRPTRPVGSIGVSGSVMGGPLLFAL
jgi:hypothetical protein